MKRMKKPEARSQKSLGMSFFTLALAAGSVLVAQTPQQQEPTFRRASETVRVYATVMDGSGRLVTDLTKDRFEIRDDGKPQPVVVFDNSPQPIQMILLLDISGSMQGNLQLLRSSSEELFSALGPNDVMRVGTFGNEIVISPEFTRDADKLRAALPTEIPEAPTPLWRAADQAMDTFDRNSDRRPVVLILSDGHDSGIMPFGKKVVSQVDVIDRAREESVMVYAVGLRGRPNMTGTLGEMMMSGMPDPGLAKTAEETGGGYVEIRPREDLGAAYRQVMRELHSQYLLGYDPPKRDGKKHKIEVRVSGGGLEPRARKNYVAPKPAK
jgi:VWFA-related protein